MTEWVLAIWITFVPLEEGKQAKELQLTIPHNSYESCVDEAKRLNQFMFTMPKLTLKIDAKCQQNESYCTDDGCPEFYKEEIIEENNVQGNSRIRI